MPLHNGGGRDWKAIADVFVSAGFDRTPVMLRNREMRISKHKHPFGGRRNRCKACGEIRAGREGTATVGEEGWQRMSGWHS